MINLVCIEEKERPSKVNNIKKCIQDSIAQKKKKKEADYEICLTHNIIGPDTDKAIRWVFSVGFAAVR